MLWTQSVLIDGVCTEMRSAKRSDLFTWGIKMHVPCIWSCWVAGWALLVALKKGRESGSEVGLPSFGPLAQRPVGRSLRSLGKRYVDGWYY